MTVTAEHSSPESEESLSIHCNTNHVKLSTVATTHQNYMEVNNQSINSGMFLLTSNYRIVK